MRRDFKDIAGLDLSDLRYLSFEDATKSIIKNTEIVYDDIANVLHNSYIDDKVSFEEISELTEELNYLKKIIEFRKRDLEEMLR